MKTLRQITMLLLALTFVACAKKDDSGARNTPEPNLKPLPGRDGNLPRKAPIKNDKDGTATTLGSTGIAGTDLPSRRKPKRDMSQDFSTSQGTQIRQQLEQEFDGISDDKQKDRNIKLAESISDVRLNIRREGNAVHAVIELKDKQKSQRIDLIGNLDGNNQASLITSLSTLRSQYSGQLNCMDKDQNYCKVSILTFEKQGPAHEKAQAKVFIRNSNGDIEFQTPSTQAQISATKKLTEMLQNEMALKLNETNSIRTSTIESFEVIRGKAAVSIMILGKNGEVLAFNGLMKLVDPGLKHTNVKLTTEINENDLALFGNLKDFKRNLQNDLQDVRLVELVNNEKFGLILRFGSDSQSEEVSFDIYRQPVTTKSLK